MSKLNTMTYTAEDWQRDKPRAWAPAVFADEHPIGTTYPPCESDSADDHDQVVVVAWEGTPIGVDIGIAPMLGHLWARGYRTYVSCQGGQHHCLHEPACEQREEPLAFIDFETPGMARRFIAEYGVIEHQAEGSLVRFPARYLR